MSAELVQAEIVAGYLDRTFNRPAPKPEMMARVGDLETARAHLKLAAEKAREELKQMKDRKQFLLSRLQTVQEGLRVLRTSPGEHDGFVWHWAHCENPRYW